MEFAHQRTAPKKRVGLITPTWRFKHLRVGVFLFRTEFVVEHRLSGQPQVRFGRIAVVSLIAGAMSAGCSMFDRPMAQPAIEAAQSTPSATTVRAQSAEPTTSAVPPTQATAPSSNPVSGLPEAPASNLATPRVVTGGLLDTAFESLFGEAPTSNWTPLSFADLFTEGWNQPFVFSPPSDSGALRQEWIDAANGVFYRQWVLDYNFRDQATSAGNRNIGTYTIFAPLSRRLELNISIPFVDDRIDRPSATSPSRRR
jgi:hypothetical protein